MRRAINPTPTSRLRKACRLTVPVFALGAMVLVATSQPAGAVSPVDLASAANASVIGGQSVNNTGPSILGQSLFLDPGPATAVTGFPPGTVLAPGVIEAADGVSLQAQADLTAAYINAFNQPTEFQVGADLVGQTLVPGVYSSGRGPLSLSGQLVLDGGGVTNPIFIFQTDSTLITASASSMVLINGANECNIFWQVGSSATLGTGSTFIGNIMALTSVSVTTGVLVHGRAMARNGSVTLDNDVFVAPDCAPSTLTAAPATTIAAAPVTVAPVTTVPAAPIPGDTIPTFGATDITLPRTGSRSVGSTSAIGGFALVLGAAAIMLARRRRPAI